ncbi:MAG: hypothetical protein SPL02_00600 [Bacilli bacterium]|nr:hypothetical protein [Bacilli bacterium]MDY6430375.1 hypothetical protein [Bacilli bacterium]
MEEVVKSKRLSLGNRPHLLLTMVYFLYMILTFAFTAVFEGEDYHVLPFDIIGDFGGMLLGNIVLGVFLLFVGKRYFNVKINYFILGLLGFCFIGNTVALIYFPNTFTWGEDFKYDLEIARRVEYIFMFLNTALFLYVTYTVAPFCRKKENSWRIIYYIIVIFAIFVIIYSYFSDFDSYYYFFNTRSDMELPPIQSFTGQKNVFGVIVLFGVFAETILMYFDHKWWRIFFILYFMFHIYVSGSRSCLMAGVFLLIVLFLYLIYDFRKRSKKLFLITFGGAALIIAIACIVTFVPYFWKWSIFEKIHNKVVGLFTSEDSTLHSRIVIWDSLFAVLKSDPMYLVFGLGSGNFNRAFFFAADNPGAKVWHTHNGYLMPFGEGGLIRGILSLLFDVYLIFKAFQIYKKYKDKSVRLYLAILGCYFIRALLEPEYLLTTEWSSLFFINFAAVPLLSVEARYKMEEEKVSRIKEPSVNYPKLDFLLIFPVILLSVGGVASASYLRFPLIAAAIIIQGLGIYLHYRNKSLTRNHFLYLGILDALVLGEAIGCCYLYKVGLAHYLFSIIFAITFAFVLHFFFIEFKLFDNCLKFIVNNEKKYSGVISRQAKEDKSIGYLEENPADPS